MILRIILEVLPPPITSILFMIQMASITQLSIQSLLTFITMGTWSIVQIAVPARKLLGTVVRSLGDQMPQALGLIGINRSNVAAIHCPTST
jgi:hypothetical protein